MLFRSDVVVIVGVVTLIELRSATTSRDHATRWRHSSVELATHRVRRDDNGPPTTTTRTTYWFLCACQRHLDCLAAAAAAKTLMYDYRLGRRRPSLHRWWGFLSSSFIDDEFYRELVFHRQAPQFCCCCCIYYRCFNFYSSAFCFTFRIFINSAFCFDVC